MKKIIFFSLVLFCTTSVLAQNAKVSDDGNYVATHTAAAKDTVLQNTGKTFTDGKGVKFPVYLAANEKLFIIRVSKNTGRAYKMYLKLEGKVN